MSHNNTHQVDHYEIGSRGPSISEDAFPQDISLGAGDRFEVGAGDHFEIGGRVEIGGPEEDPTAAVRQVIKTARDNRQPPPKMKAVDVDAPVEEDQITPWFADVSYDVGCMIGAADPFPLMTKFLQRFGAGQEKPRFVRVDTEESYQRFLAENSPEMAEMQAHLLELSDKLEQHLHDPHAHEDLLQAIDEAEAIGAEVAEVEKTKEIEMWLPEWARGKVRAWKEGEFICASIHLPGSDGELRICTAMTPAGRALEEMEAHAATANVSVGAIEPVLPAMADVLGAGTLVKEMAAAAPSILQRPEASTKEAFVCRIEPKASPTLCAFIALAQECGHGNEAACAEWNALASAAEKGGAGHVAKAMREAKAIFCKATGKAA
jgi:hypothetical protein